MPETEESSDLSSFLKDLLDLDSSIIKSLIQEFNNKGVNVTYHRVSEIAGRDTNNGINIRDALAFIFNHYESKKESFDEDIKSVTIDKGRVEEFKSALGTLNEKGQEALRLQYEILMNAENPFFLGLESQMLLSDIVIDNKQYYSPQVRLRFDYIDLEDEERSDVFNMPLDKFYTFVESLNNVRSKLATQAKVYREKIGPEVLIIDGEQL